jgi:hypothetical protein
MIRNSTVPHPARVRSVSAHTALVVGWRISDAIANGRQPAYGRADAVTQARVLEAVRQSGEHESPVEIGD